MVDGVEYFVVVVEVFLNRLYFCWGFDDDEFFVFS